jgi:cellobiose-specific phosphotransferase system component IIA
VQGFGTALMGNTQLLGYFIEKGERSAAFIQGIGVISNYAVLFQVRTVTSQFALFNAQCSMLPSNSTQARHSLCCSMLNAQCSMLNAQCSMINAAVNSTHSSHNLRCSMLNAAIKTAPKHLTICAVHAQC